MANGCWMRRRLSSYTYTMTAKKNIIKYTYTTYTNTSQQGWDQREETSLQRKLKWSDFDFGENFFSEYGILWINNNKKKYFIKIWPSFCLGLCVYCWKCVCNELDILEAFRQCVDNPTNILRLWTQMLPYIFDHSIPADTLEVPTPFRWTILCLSELSTEHICR